MKCVYKLVFFSYLINVITAEPIFNPSTTGEVYGRWIRKQFKKHLRATENEFLARIRSTVLSLQPNVVEL